MDCIVIPGTECHELPPLFVRSATAPQTDWILESAMEVVEAEEIMPGFVANPEQRRFDLAVNLMEGYFRFVAAWQWGDSILDWTRQCEVTFEGNYILRPLLHPDIWPHASRSSFVKLLAAKAVPSPLPVEKTVGLRLTFRQPPPIECFSDQFLFYLNLSVAESAYRAWANMNPEETALLPPDRFHFQLVPLG